MILFEEDLAFENGGSRYQYVHVEDEVKQGFEYWKTHCSGKTLS